MGCETCAADKAELRTIAFWVPWHGLAELEAELGGLGMVTNVESGIVDEVEDGSQAQALGVQVRWKIVEVNGKPYSDWIMERTCGRKRKITFQTIDKVDVEEAHRRWVTAQAEERAAQKKYQDAQRRHETESQKWFNRQATEEAMNAMESAKREWQQRKDATSTAKGVLMPFNGRAQRRKKKCVLCAW